jgi:hypothetical protein
MAVELDDDENPDIYTTNVINVSIYMNEERKMVIEFEADSPFTLYYVVNKMFGCKHPNTFINTVELPANPSTIKHLLVPKNGETIDILNSEFDQTNVDDIFTCQVITTQWSISHALTDTISRMKVFSGEDTVTFVEETVNVEDMGWNKVIIHKTDDAYSFAFNLTTPALARHEGAYKLKYGIHVNDQNVGYFNHLHQVRNAQTIPDGNIICENKTFYQMQEEKQQDLMGPDSEFARKLTEIKWPFKVKRLENKKRKMTETADNNAAAVAH